MLIKDFVTKQIVIDAMLSTDKIYDDIEITNDYIRVYYNKSKHFALYVDIWFGDNNLYISEYAFKTNENVIIKYIHQQYRLFNIKEILE